MGNGILSSITNTKHNLNGVVNVFTTVFSPQERLRIRSKVTEVNINGVLYSAVCPEDTFIEKFYESNHIDTVNSSGTFDSINWQYTLLPTQILQGKVIAKDPRKAFNTVTLKVNGGVFAGELYIDYGNGFILVGNGVLNTITDSINLGQPLNAPLDLALSGLRFSNALRYKLINTSVNTINVTKLVMNYTYY